MSFIFKEIISIIVAIMLQLGVVSAVETTPDDAVADLLDGLKAGDSSMTERYLDNQYVNLLVNAQGDEAVIERMYDALFKNFNYKIEEVGEKNDVAVAKVTITCNDFSGVGAAYDKASYDYVMSNLYTKDIEDKDKLNAKCLDIYVQQIESAAASEAVTETVVFIPMTDNGNYGWNVLLTDELMQQMLGNLQLPVSDTVSE